MIKHVVLFKLKTFSSDHERSLKETQIRDALLALKDKIKELKQIEVGLNANHGEEYNIALIATFDSFDDLNTYAKHPDHVAAGALIRPVLEHRACTDYEV